MNPVSNIVLACEQSDAESLVFNVDLALTQKLDESLDRQRRHIGETLLTSPINESLEEEWTDTFEQYSPNVQEAIGYVIDSVNESNMELENTISMASKQFNVEESQIREYFTSLTETADVDSTRSDDGDEKRGVRDDMDTNKRIRYESTEFHLINGDKVTISETHRDAINAVISNLTEEHQEQMDSMLRKNIKSFGKMVNFCVDILKD